MNINKINTTQESFGFKKNLEDLNNLQDRTHQFVLCYITLLVCSTQDSIFASAQSLMKRASVKSTENGDPIEKCLREVLYQQVCHSESRLYRIFARAIVSIICFTVGFYLTTIQLNIKNSFEKALESDQNTKAQFLLDLCIKFFEYHAKFTQTEEPSLPSELNEEMVRAILQFAKDFNKCEFIKKFVLHYLPNCPQCLQNFMINLIHRLLPSELIIQNKLHDILTMIIEESRNRIYNTMGETIKTLLGNFLLNLNTPDEMASNSSDLPDQVTPASTSSVDPETNLRLETALREFLKATLTETEEEEKKTLSIFGRIIAKSFLDKGLLAFAPGMVARIIQKAIYQYTHEDTLSLVIQEAMEKVDYFFEPPQDQSVVSGEKFSNGLEKVLDQKKNELTVLKWVPFMILSPFLLRIKKILEALLINTKANKILEKITFETLLILLRKGFWVRLQNRTFGTKST